MKDETHVHVCVPIILLVVIAITVTAFCVSVKGWTDDVAAYRREALSRGYAYFETDPMTGESTFKWKEPIKP